MQIAYTLAMPAPKTHLYRVTIDVSGVRDPYIDFVLPAWTPGAYAVRDFAKNVQDIDCGSRPWKKIDKSRWRVFADGASRVRVTYDLFAYEMGVDTCHLDGEHAYFNGAGVFMYVDGQKHRPVTLDIRAPRGWKVVTGLDGGPSRFSAPNYDVLIDCPTEIGTAPVRAFRVRGKRHRVLIHGANNWDAARVTRDCKKLVEEYARMFGGLPYDHYLFLYHAAVTGLGGLEHLNSTAMTLNPWAGKPDKQYERIIEVTSHEFFHLWNVKRIRPKVLGPFDYEREVYTSLLWLCEGFTSYYDDLMCCRAKLYPAKRYLKKMAEAIQGYREKPSRLRSALSQSSFDTWLWAYKPHPQTVNRFMSYYEKGALVGMCLDLEIRKRTRNRRSLDDVMRHLWREIATKERTIEENAMPRLVAEAVGGNYDGFFSKYVDGVHEVPFESFLRHAGLEIRKEPQKTDGEAEPREVAWMGVQTRPGAERPIVASVTEGAPAYRDGVSPEDEILALDGVRVDNANFTSLLKDRKPGDRLEVTVFRGSSLTRVPVTLGSKDNHALALVPRASAGTLEKSIYASWLKSKWEVSKPASK